MKGRFQEVPNRESTRAPITKIKPCIIYWSSCPFCCYTLLGFHCESCFFNRVGVGVRFQPRFCYSLFFFLFLFTDLSCVVEVDHFGQFLRKAKTKTCKATTDPVWEQVS